MAQVKVFSLGGIGAPCCCGGIVTPCTGAYPIPTGNLNLAISPAESINGYMASAAVLSYPGFLGPTSWSKCYCWSLCGPGSEVNGPCPSIGGSNISLIYLLQCGVGGNPPTFSKVFNDGRCTNLGGSVSFSAFPTSYSSSPFQIVYQNTVGATTYTYTITS